MAPEESSHTTSYNQACKQCRKVKRRCIRSAVHPGACNKCHESGIECSLLDSILAPSLGVKRKTEDFEDIPDSEPYRMGRSSSSATASLTPYESLIVVPPKKSRHNKPPQPAPLNRTVPSKKRKIISTDDCGICLKTEISSGEKDGDRLMLKCDIESCLHWYHLSCIQFRSNGNRIFQSLATGTKETMFICQECFDPKRKDLVMAVAQAESDFRTAMENIKRTVTAQKEGRPTISIPSSSQERENPHSFEHDTVVLRMDVSPTTDFEPTKDKYQGFQLEVVKSLLSNIEQAVYDYDRDIVCANELFLDESDVLKSTPLKVWNQVDPSQDFLSGKEWFDVDRAAKNLSQSHAPITAALRQILRTPDDEQLHISSDLEELSFSQVHIALINWFVIDVLNKSIDLYLFPNMKPLRIMLSAMANFGDARWKGQGRQVVRELQLRAWDKTEFRGDVVERVGYELRRCFEEFLAPLTRKIGRIDPRSQSRANIIKHTVELWSYLDAAHGQMQIIHPMTGKTFDHKACANADDNIEFSRAINMKVKWVSRRGFWFREMRADGTAMMVKPLVILE